MRHVIIDVRKRKDGPQNDNVNFDTNVESTIDKSIEDENVYFPTKANGHIEERSDNGEKH